jgi:hypothetical protein
MSVYVNLPFGSRGLSPATSLIYKFLTAHRSIAEIPRQRDSPSTLLRVVRGTEYAEKGITYRFKTRIAGVPITSNWDIWKAFYGKNKRAYFFHEGFPYYIQAIRE